MSGRPSQLRSKMFPYSDDSQSMFNAGRRASGKVGGSEKDSRLSKTKDDLSLGGTLLLA